MRVRRRAMIVALGATFVCCAFVLAVAAPPASAEAPDNFDKCRALGGSMAACCAGVGGTYRKDASGNESCTYVIKAEQAENGPNPGTGHLQFVRPETGVLTSFAASDGRSQAGLHGLQQVVSPPVIIG
jgi:hypothetical protein